MSLQQRLWYEAFRQWILEGRDVSKDAVDRRWRYWKCHRSHGRLERGTDYIIIPSPNHDVAESPSAAARCAPSGLGPGMCFSARNKILYLFSVLEYHQQHGPVEHHHHHNLVYFHWTGARQTNDHLCLIAGCYDSRRAIADREFYLE